MNLAILLTGALAAMLMTSVGSAAPNIYPDPGFEKAGEMGEARPGERAGRLEVRTESHWDAIGSRLEVEPFARYRVAEWYKAALSTWEQSASFETAESVQLVYADGAGQAVQLTMATEAEHTAISCWYAKAEVAVESAPKAKVPPEKLPGPGMRKMGPGQKGIKGKKVKGR